MDQRADVAHVRPEGLAPLDRFVRIAFVVYLSPVLLIVFAIGLAGMLASKMRPTARVAVEGLHPTHKPNRPLGLARVPTQVRERV
jgi:hypothetical protein